MQALAVAFRLAGGAPVGEVPVGAGDEGLAVDLEVLVDLVGRLDGPGPARHGDAGGGLEAEVRPAGVEHPVHERPQRPGHASVVHRRAHDEAITFGALGYEVVAAVLVEHAAAIAGLMADAAGDAPADFLVADPDKLGLHALGLKGGRSLLQRPVRVALPARAPVDEQYLHDRLLFL